MAGESTRPSVLDPDESWHLPARVYVAARPDRDGPVLEIREWSGQSLILAYSSLDRFLHGCGADQPWMLFESSRLAELAADGTTPPEGGVFRQGGEFRFGVLLDVSLSRPMRGTAGGMADADPAWNDPSSADWDLAYCACQPYQPRAERVNLELQPMPGDHLAVMAYSSQGWLRESCGPQQTGIPLPAGLLGQARRQSGADTICLDTPLPDYLRHTA